MRKRYLRRATFVVWAVVLVYEYGILDIVHGHFFKADPLHESFAGPCPTLDPHPILSTFKSCISQRHILHPFFFHILSQASYTDAMAWTAFDAFHPQVLRAWADGYAVITGSDGGADDGHVAWALDVYAVCVWAVPGCYNVYSLEAHVAAAVYDNVEHLTV